ncbi:MAG TPA: winged helix-turn-helix domain-containing protein [Pyrinomonadaceae bacterium]|nr:winged helix-turn-helix domain-containing protein [Pyrinomonadaceae bacterium]
MTKEKSEIFLFDDFRVDAGTFKLWKGNTTVAVEPKAFRVLLFLIHNRGRLIEKEELLDSVWKETSVTENALTREIAKLRRLLGDDPKQSRYIQTVHTRGYRFVADVEVVTSGDVRDSATLENGAGKSETHSKTQTPATTNGNGFRTGHAATTETTTQATSTRSTDNGASLSSVVASEPDASGATDSSNTSTAEVKTRRTRSRKRAFVLAGIICVGVAAAIAAPFAWNIYQESDRPTPPTVVEITPITSAPGLDLNPSFSPDGNTLAYTSDRSGSLEIYAKPLAPGGREMQLTSDGNQNREPAWSPDGSTIAYHSAKRGGIWLMPALGGVPKRLTEFGCSPAWSRDGSTVAFQSESFHDMIQPYASSATLWVVAVSGGSQPRQVTRADAPAGGHLFPTWSPDGRRLAFLNANMASMQIWSVAIDGSELQQLSPDGTGDKADVVYAPDGKSIFFTMGMMLGKFRVSPETGARIGRPAKVADLGSTLFRHPTFSRDGGRLAYSAWTVKSNVWSVPISPQTHEAAGFPHALTDELNSRNSLTAFSPDGRKIAFTSMRRGSGYQLWLMDSDGRNQTQLTTDADAAYSATWYASGARLAFQCMREGRTTLSVIELEGRRETALAEAGNFEFLRLSPDAQQVAFTYAPDNFFNVGIMPSAGGQPRQLTFEKTFTGLANWSPDGRWLAFQSKRGDDMQIMLVPPDGSAPPTQLTSDAGDKWPYGWSPDGTKIAYAGARDGIWNVWWLSLTDKTTRQLTGNTRAGVIIRFPDWSPLGNQIVYEQAEITGNIYVMSLKEN